MRVSLDNLRPEMVLASDIVDGMGRLLLPTGTALTDRHLRYCQMWGVLEADIEGDDPPPSDAGDDVDPSALARAEPPVRDRFAHCDLTHPAVDALYRYCVRAHARKHG